MLALLYLVLCVLVGREITEHFLLRRVRETAGNGFWILFPMSFGSGVLILTWILYAAAYCSEKILKTENALLYGNVIVMAAAFLYCCFGYLKRKKDEKKILWKEWIRDQQLFRKELAFFSVLFLFLTAILFYVFYVSDGYLHAGFTVFSDYAPHTAMIRSFSMGNNFPTQYPHFGGEDVKYHFMFQFLTGNLEYLGMRIDLAYNLVSVFSLWGFLVMLYKLSERIMGKHLAGALCVVIFFFRSGLSFYRFAFEHLKAGDLWWMLKENTAFIGYTPNENWGLWCFNVYLNQRHLAFGLLIVTMALWVFMDWLEDADLHPEKGMLWMKKRLFSAEAWKSKDLLTAIVTGILLGLAAFWNGAAVIGGLLILAGFALFSDGKIDYAIMALVTVILSSLQSGFFMEGSSIGFSFYWGLLAEDRSFFGVLWFLIQLSGVYFLGLAVVCFFVRRLQRASMLAFFLPFFFAFTISLTPDIAVNHKYVMMSYAFLGMFWAYVLIEIWKKRRGGKLAAVAVAVCLLITGIYDFVIILKDNGPSHQISVNLNSDVTRWLGENIGSQELVLTPEYSMHEVTMSGIMMYCGWPYYAWSAGYDTFGRSAIAAEIYTSEDKERVDQLVKEEGITYILYEEGMSFDEQWCQENTIRELYPLVYESEDSFIRIYEVL